MKLSPKILLLALVIGAAPQALARQYDHGGTPRQANGAVIADSGEYSDLRIAQSNGPTLSEAVEMVKRQCQCRIVNATTKVSGGREVHIIKFMTKDGTVKTRRIPGRSSKP